MTIIKLLPILAIIFASYLLMSCSSIEENKITDNSPIRTQDTIRVNPLDTIFVKYSQDIGTYDWGWIKSEVTVKNYISLTNDAPYPILLLRVRGGSGCYADNISSDYSTVGPENINPNETFTFMITRYIKGKSGTVLKNICLHIHPVQENMEEILKCFDYIGFAEK